MDLETHWAATTAKRVRAETRHVGWKAAEVRAMAAHHRKADGAGNVRTVATMSLAEILGAGFTPGRRVGV